ncbi:F-box domain containing protein [Penicillium digitatum]|uniref:F-box domain containing protein n=1 Tax=Penicillium digitatum TaxID=36651 RepID=A0A7T6XSJ4_PENDI|nr:F-box domain containing protein [Penicillium digitatum]
MYAQWLYHLEDCQRDHAPAQWGAFKIPQTLLETPLVTQSSGLVALPNELLLQIIANAHSVDQLSLALTCKRMLALSAMATITIPSAPMHRAYSLNCSAMLALLRALQPRGARGHPKKSWAPCCVCYRYRPKRRGYWTLVEKLYEEDLFCGILAGYEYVVDSWSDKRSSSYQCPECWSSVAATHPPLGQNRFFRHPGSFSQDRDDLVEQSRSDSPTQSPPAAVSGVKKHLN